MTTTKRRRLDPAMTAFLCISCCALLVMGAGLPSDVNPVPNLLSAPVFQSKMLEVGEELEYKVSYSWFNIGTIRTLVTGREEKNGRNVYKTRAFIDSNPGLDWLVSLHIKFYSEMDEAVHSYTWVEDDSSKNGVYFKRFRFDYEKKAAELEYGRKLPSGERKVDSTETVAITDRCQDGLSLFYYAREHVHEPGQVRVPTLIENKQVYTHINFMNRHEDSDIDATEYPVDVVAFDGKADYVGIFGLTGGFRGWFSNDDARVPILARMNVILGSIKIQLQKWNRPGWQPPKYVETPGK